MSQLLLVGHNSKYVHILVGFEVQNFVEDMDQVLKT